MVKPFFSDKGNYGVNIILDEKEDLQNDWKIAEKVK